MYENTIARIEDKAARRQDWITAEFNTWWDEVGSGITAHPGHDNEEHAKNVARLAWLSGAVKGIQSKNAIQ